MNFSMIVLFHAILLKFIMLVAIHATLLERCPRLSSCPMIFELCHNSDYPMHAYFHWYSISLRVIRAIVMYYFKENTIRNAGSYFQGMIFRWHAFCFWA